MQNQTRTAIAHPNIAFIKYWGNRDNAQRIPANGSISMNLAALQTVTSVTFREDLPADEFLLEGLLVDGSRLDRVVRFLDHVRSLAAFNSFARVESSSNFPIGVGIASSASAFAALAVASASAVGLPLDERELSRLARRGSGSACRSIPGGFVEWLPGHTDHDSYAVSVAPSNHWDLVDCVALLQTSHKSTGSTQGHTIAATSPLQPARVDSAPRRIDLCRQAVLQRDFDALASIVELDSNMMHAVMMTSTPPLMYWLPESLRLMKAVQRWRKQGCPVCYTLDAGPNVHILCEADFAPTLQTRLGRFEGVQQVLVSPPGGPAHPLS